MLVTRAASTKDYRLGILNNRNLFIVSQFWRLGVLPHQPWVCSSLHSKANLLTLGALKESTAFTAGHQARRRGSSCSEDMESFDGFQGIDFKGSVREGLQGLESAGAQSSNQPA